jgi:hypothetical protein
LFAAGVARALPAAIVRKPIAARAIEGFGRAYFIPASFSLITSCCTTAAPASAPWRRPPAPSHTKSILSPFQGVATGVLLTFQQIGLALGITVGMAVLTAAAKSGASPQ